MLGLCLESGFAFQHVGSSSVEGLANDMLEAIHMELTMPRYIAIAQPQRE
jgi:hypothetical protein